MTERLEIRNQYMRNLVMEADRPNLQWGPDGSYVTFDQAVNLIAAAREPLRIELPDLGYQLTLDLKKFQTVYKQGSISYFGHFFFQAKTAKNKRAQKRYEEKRERAYFNSSLHFLRALFTEELAENGYQLLEEIHQEGGRGVQVTPFDISPHLEPLSEDQKVIKDLAGRNFVLLFYGDRKGRPLPPAKWKKRQPIQSGIHFGDQPCIIRSDGTIGESGLYFSGNMGNRGVAWLLPSDYRMGDVRGR